MDCGKKRRATEIWKELMIGKELATKKGRRGKEREKGTERGIERIKDIVPITCMLSLSK